MPFTARWITAAGTIVFDGNPYKIESGAGLGAAEVRNLWERGPQQDGVSDLGYRIDPRTATIPILFAGTSATHLDSLRDTLQRHFSPRAGMGTLQITRDDGEVREIYARRTGPLDMPLVATHKPGNLHKTAVQLFAPDPVWTKPGANAGTVLLGTSWWLAYGAIGTANVLDHVESPGTAQLWAYTGTVTAGSSWMIAFRSGTVSANGDYAFAVGQPGDPQITGWRYNSSQYEVLVNDVFLAQGTSVMSSGTHNYFVIADGVGGDAYLYRDNVLVATGGGQGGGGLGASTPGTARRWRSDAAGNASSTWGEPLPRAAIYNIAPTAAQRANLHASMAASGTAFSFDLVYAGDLPEYPVVRINGPISDPVLVNTATDERLDFTGYTIGSGDYYDIDLRYGRKTVRNSGGDRKIGQLSKDSDLASFHIAPAPEVSGGTNTFQLTGTATAAPTNAVITYYNRFESW